MICISFCNSSSISILRIKIADDCLVLWNQLNSNLTLQNRWGNKNEILRNTLDKYVQINSRLYSHIYLHSKNTHTLKKSSTLATLKMEKQANWFVVAEMWEKHLEKKRVLIKAPASLLKISLWDGFHFLLVQTWFLCKWNIDSEWVIPNN